MITALHVGIGILVALVASLTYLLVVYGRIYRRMKQPFTLGLIIFAALLLFQYLITAARAIFLVYVAEIELPPAGTIFADNPDLMWFLLIPGIIQLAAVLVLVRLTRL